MFPSRLHKLSWSLAVLLATTGIILSAYKLGDRLWLARSGALITTLGIWTTYQRLKSVEFWRGLTTIVQKFGELKILRKHAADEEKQKELKKANEARVNELYQREREAIERRYAYHEVGLLMVGTIIWGFGDLIQYIWKS